MTDQAKPSMNDATRRMVREFVELHRGIEGAARFMSRELRIGGIKACRALVQEALA